MLAFVFINGPGAWPSNRGLACLICLSTIASESTKCFPCCPCVCVHSLLFRLDADTLAKAIQVAKGGLDMSKHKQGGHNNHFPKGSGKGHQKGSGHAPSPHHGGDKWSTWNRNHGAHTCLFLCLFVIFCVSLLGRRRQQEGVVQQPQRQAHGPVGQQQKTMYRLKR